MGIAKLKRGNTEAVVYASSVTVPTTTPRAAKAAKPA